MTLPTLDQVISTYLYGQTTPPATLPPPRPATLANNPVIQVDTQEYMNTVGRFAVGAQFDIIKDFFQSSTGAITPGTYTKTEMATILGYGPGTDNPFYGWETNQYLWQDGTDDYLRCHCHSLLPC